MNRDIKVKRPCAQKGRDGFITWAAGWSWAEWQVASKRFGFVKKEVSMTRLKHRKTKEEELRKHKDLLIESVRTHLPPAFIQRGFAVVSRVRQEPADRKSVGTFPFELLRRARPDGAVDLVEIQFATYQRAAFRINACAVLKEGMMTLGGHRSVEELHAGGLHDHLQIHARPWLRPSLRALGLEPLGAWFSLPLWWFRSPLQANYDKLALRVASFLPEIELALREGKLGPHMRQIVFPAKLRGSTANPSLV
ncbi:MAG TPA: hypothetical protein VFA71_06175 [Terriglobales bacterium]|nr:hypothetical protein [Terriglobales bacterium]